MKLVTRTCRSNPDVSAFIDDHSLRAHSGASSWTVARIREESDVAISIVRCHRNHCWRATGIVGDPTCSIKRRVLCEVKRVEVGR